MQSGKGVVWEGAGRGSREVPWELPLRAGFSMATGLAVPGLWVELLETSHSLPLFPSLCPQISEQQPPQGTLGPKK